MTVNGEKFRLKDMKGKVLLLNFWGTWCGPCRREIPDFVKLQSKYKKNGLEIVGITLTSGLQIISNPSWMIGILIIQF